jgi:hypothetical protein
MPPYWSATERRTQTARRLEAPLGNGPQQQHAGHSRRPNIFVASSGLGSVLPVNGDNGLMLLLPDSSWRAHTRALPGSTLLRGPSQSAQEKKHRLTVQSGGRSQHRRAAASSNRILSVTGIPARAIKLFSIAHPKPHTKRCIIYISKF